jgi:hypothetical protein
VHVARLVGNGAWSVTYLWGFGGAEPEASVSISRTSATVAFNYWNDAASAQLFVTYGRAKVERVSRTKAQWVVPIHFSINVNGAVIVLFRDALGHVYTGWGTPLQAGPMAAG